MQTLNRKQRREARRLANQTTQPATTGATPPATRPGTFKPRKLDDPTRRTLRCESSDPAKRTSRRFPNGFIHLKVEGNPKKPGSGAYDRFALYKEGMSTAAFLAAGGISLDLSWDVEHGFIEIRKEPMKLSVTGKGRKPAEPKADKPAEPAAAETAPAQEPEAEPASAGEPAVEATQAQEQVPATEPDAA